LNLIKRKIDKSKCNILEFREFQYSLIPELISICMEYMKVHGFKYNEKEYKASVIDDTAYNSKYSFSSLVIKVETNNNPKIQTFLEFVIPKLIEGQMFKLNGTLYCPQLYLVDEMITIKKSSISLYSLFNPLTLYGTENRVIFLGNNIPINRFLKLYYTEDEISKLDFPFEVNTNNESMDVILQNFSDILGVPPVLSEIIEKIDLLFFDGWTSGLYKEYYGIEPSMKDLLDEVSEIDSTQISFIDMDHKRLVFVEYIMAPLFKSVTFAVNKMIRENEDIKFLNIKLGEIVKYFFNELQKSNRYDSVNGFSGILNLKASFKNPKGGSELPTEVSNVHESFKGKICSVTVSNTNPGESITLVPEQNLKNLRYGIFE
jgi:hypothetical protein